MASQVLVTGGTGTLGRLVVPLLLSDGCRVRVLSRRSHEGSDGVEYVTGDLAKGERIEAAVDGAEIIVHCAGTPKGDEAMTKNLVRAATRAGRPYLVFISVVGADRIPVVTGVDRAMFGYFGAKLAAERVVAESGLPWTTLRATQFYDAILLTGRLMSRLPVMPVPAGFRFQPVDAGEVAVRLVELARARRPAWCPTWPGRGCTGWMNCFAGTCGPVASTGRWCMSGSLARPPERSGPARTWRRTELWAGGPGKTSWPTGCDFPHITGPGCMEASGSPPPPSCWAHHCDVSPVGRKGYAPDHDPAADS